ncbi:MAG: T9SS type A sorting domain-containing protein [Ignavibacteriales bacterium]|nr:T9SS type A sorting domain-containing protein [Ignavibacteriales bacterium]
MNINLFSTSEIIIKVENINAFRAYSIHLGYDSQKLRCLNISRSSFFSNWQTFFYATIDSNSNILKIDEAILGPGYEDGSGDLIKIQFQALEEGDISLNFLTTDLRDTSDNQIPIQSQNGVIHIFGPTFINNEIQNSSDIGLQSYPNPFNSSTRIDYTAKYGADTDFYIYSITGEEIFSYRVDANSDRNISFTWHGKSSDGTVLPSGVYLLTVQNKNDFQRIKIILLK